VRRHIVKAGDTAAAAATLEQHRRAARANPRNAQAHGLLGLALQKLGRLEEAVASQRRALELDRTLTDLHATMAAALHALDRNEAAVDSYRRALRSQQQDADLHKGLSDALRALGQFDAAAASARRAAALRPDDVPVRLSLAAAQHGGRDYAGAADSFGQVLAIMPEHVDVRFDLGQTLSRLGRFEEAMTCSRRVIEQRPDHIDAHLLLAACQRELKQPEAAVATYQLALAIAPDHATALHELGVTLHQLGKLQAAHASLQRALEVAPGNQLILGSLAHVCFELGLLEQALHWARRRLELNPDSAAAHSAVLFILSHYCTDASELTAEHRQFGARWDTPQAQAALPPDQRDPGRRLRIGFVSADLYHHAVARFIDPIFELLKHSTALTLHVYYNNVVEDMVTRRMRNGMAHWHQIADLDDDAVERQIRADGIDILIDLSGHSARNRLPLFARKPAPVQASWIGYAGTTGLQAMDYYLSDQFHLPEGRYDDQFTEKIVRLPLSAPFSPEVGSPPVNPLPALSNGYLTLGSFHRSSKLSRNVIALWAQLLRALPDAKMVLGGLHEGDDTTLLAWFDEEGIARSRLLLRQRTTMHEYLLQHHEVDLCLSPFPYSGSTTICHALWMGVPTLATIGPTNPSHAAICYLAHLGLSSFMADDDPTFVKLGEFLSQNLPTLAALRAGMRERFNASVVGYPGVAAAGLEHALRLMWQRWCADLPPAPLRVRLADLVEPDTESDA
jgi:protein O-GlcNAc transferase